MPKTAKKEAWEQKKYQIIYADPPWQYDFAPKKSVAIESHYPTMNQDELKSLRVPSADNAVLYLWAQEIVL